ncbi:hypothetical protein Goshw_024858, partial [Gossypium schwendimanii]|nr:hypothetical protein [Gossypium schwendimanii]
NTYYDIEAVYNCLKKEYGVTAILSGIRVLYPVKMTFWFDIFKVSSIFTFLLN